VLVAAAAAAAGWLLMRSPVPARMRVRRR